MLDTVEILCISTFIGLFVSLFILMITKSYYHFDYLKRLNPDKFKKYGNYFDTFNFNEFFNQYRISLLFPGFKRYLRAEETEEAEKLARRVKLFSKLTVYNILLIIVFVAVLLIFWGDFS